MIQILHVNFFEGVDKGRGGTRRQLAERDGADASTGTLQSTWGADLVNHLQFIDSRSISY